MELSIKKFGKNRSSPSPTVLLLVVVVVVVVVVPGREGGIPLHRYIHICLRLKLFVMLSQTL